MAPYSVIYYGTPQFAVPALEALIAAPELFQVKAVITQPDRPAGRGGKVTRSPIGQVAERHNIPILQPTSVRKEIEDFKAKLSPFGPLDIAVVAAFGQILPIEALSIPQAGSINIHASILPRWRGAAPIHRAILAGDQETGVALMQMEAGLDTGPVFATTRIRIEGTDTSGSLLEKLSRAGAHLLLSELPRIINREITATPQAIDGVTLAAKITNDEAKINWSNSAVEIDRKIRAFSPFPGAFTYLGSQRVKIYLSSPKSDVAAIGKNPGEIALMDPRKLEIATGSGTLSVEEAQIEGRKRLPIQEFLRGVTLSNASIFGGSPQ